MEIDHNFLMMFVQITAILLGFAFLVPVVQSVSSGLFSRAQTCIKPRVLYQRVFLLVSLPLCAFFLPFLISLLLLIIEANKSGMLIIRAISFVFGIGMLVCFLKTKSQTGVGRPKYMNVLFSCVGGFLLVYVLFLMPATYLLGFAPFVYSANLFFTILGLWFLVDNVLTPFDRGISFKTSELNEEWSEKEVEESFKNIDRALRARGKVVRQLVGFQQCHIGEGEWHHSIAKHCSEIRFLYEQYKGPRDKRFTGLRQEYEDFRERERAERKSPVLSDLFEFDNRRRGLVENYLPEFERVTDEAVRLLKRLGQ